MKPVGPLGHQDVSQFIRNRLLPGMTIEYEPASGIRPPKGNPHQTNSHLRWQVAPGAIARLVGDRTKVHDLQLLIVELG